VLAISKLLMFDRQMMAAEFEVSSCYIIFFLAYAVFL
jgi:hypothetical protein